MEQSLQSHTGTWAGTIGGTLFCLIANLHLDDLMKTAILAAVGAVVSFCVSLLLKQVIKRLKK